MVFQVRKPQQVPFFFLISALGRAAGVRTTIGEGTCCFPAVPETGRHNTRGICTLYTINAIHMSTPFYYQASAIHCLKRFISFSGSDIPHISRCTFSPRHRPFPACLPTFFYHHPAGNSMKGNHLYRFLLPSYVFDSVGLKRFEAIYFICFARLRFLSEAV